MSEFVPNLRDVGGLPTEHGVATAYGVLLRSAAPTVTDVVPDDVTWPPAQVVDLRSPLESGPEHPLAGAGTTVQRISLLEALRPDLQRADPATVEQMRSGGLERLYLGMLEIAQDELVQVVRLVADHPGPTLVHCAAGKDRTGVVVALMLRAVGVHRDAVVTDYLETQRATEAIVRRLATQPVLDPKRPVPPAYLELPVEAIEGVLDVWDTHDDGAAGWLTTAAQDAALVDRLRARLLGHR